MRAVDSPKKRTNEFVCFLPWKAKKQKKTNLFVRSFFVRIYGSPICLRFYLTFSKLSIVDFLIAILHRGLRNDFFCHVTYFFFHILFGLFSFFSIWTFLFFFFQFLFNFSSISVQFQFSLSFYIPFYLITIWFLPNR